MTLFRAEAGSPAIALGTLLRILSVLGLQSDLDTLARDDKVGRLLQDQGPTSLMARARYVPSIRLYGLS